MDKAILELKDLLAEIRGHLYFELDAEINTSANEPRVNRPERRAGIIEDLIARIEAKLDTVWR